MTVVAHTSLRATIVFESRVVVPALFLFCCMSFLSCCWGYVLRVYHVFVEMMRVQYNIRAFQGRVGVFCRVFCIWRVALSIFGPDSCFLPLPLASPVCTAVVDSVVARDSKRARAGDSGTDNPANGGGGDGNHGRILGPWLVRWRGRCHESDPLPGCIGVVHRSGGGGGQEGRGLGFGAQGMDGGERWWQVSTSISTLVVAASCCVRTYDCFWRSKGTERRYC